MSTTYSLTLDTPDGAFTALINGDAVLASGWTDTPEYFVPLIHSSLRPDPRGIFRLDPHSLRRQDAVLEHAQPDPTLVGRESSHIRVATQAQRAVEAFYDGDASLVGRIPVKQKSGPYREHAWQILREVAPGEVITYAQYAERTGNPKAARAAASACAMNAAALFVPCHRVLRTDGTLGGFRYGLPIKERLLAREGLELITVSA